MKKLKTSLLFSQFKFLDCPKQGKSKAIFVILQSEQINKKITYSERPDKTVHEPAVHFCQWFMTAIFFMESEKREIISFDDANGRYDLEKVLPYLWAR